VGAVAAGKLNPLTTWPEYFADPATFVPSTDADLSGFAWEPPTPESYEKDLAAVMAASEQVSLREGPDPAMKPPRGPMTSPEFDWV
jgi:hypothetical protein